MSLHSRLLVPPHDEFAQSHGCAISAGLSTASDQAVFTRRAPRVFIGSQMLWIQDIQHPRFVFRVVSSDRTHCRYTA